MPGIVLQTRDLAVGFRGQPVLHGLSFNVRSGEVLGLVGPNGVGKTTLLSTIAGGRRQMSGTIERAERTALVPQQSGLYEMWTARHNLQLFAADELRAPGAAELLERLGLTNRTNQRVFSMSGGFRRRVSIACAALAQPELMLLDEPTTNLDSESRLAVIGVLRDLVHADPGCGIVIASHNLRDVEELCDRVLLLKGGDRVQAGTPDELRVALMPGELLRVVVATSTDVLIAKTIVERHAEFVDDTGLTVEARFADTPTRLVAMRELTTAPWGGLIDLQTASESFEDALLGAFLLPGTAP